MWQIKKFFFVFFCSFVLSCLLFGLARLFTKKLKISYDKISEYECGFEVFDNATRNPYNTQFYLIGILFLLFDVELAMLFPWTINYFDNNWITFFSGILFIVFIIYGVYYEWWMEIITWYKSKKNSCFLLSFNVIYNKLNLLSLPDKTGYLLTQIDPAICFISILLLWQILLKKKITLFKPVLLSLTSQLCLFVLMVSLFFSVSVLALVKSQNVWTIHLLTILFKTLNETNELLNYVNVFLIYIFILGALNFKTNTGTAHKILENIVFIAILYKILMQMLQTPNFFFFLTCLIGSNLIQYALIFLNKVNDRNQEPLIKYFYLSTITTIIILYVIWLILELINSVNFYQISFVFDLYKKLEIFYIYIFFILTLLILSLFFKLAVFPCHFWTPELYKTCNFNVIFIIAIPIKLVFVLFLLKLTEGISYSFFFYSKLFFWISAIFSIILGLLGAIFDRNLKSFFAYSSINQMGFVLAGLCCFNYNGAVFTFYYVVVYTITVILLLQILTHFNGKYKNFIFIDQFALLKTSNFLLIFGLTLCLFSLAGVPVLAGFFSKYLLLFELYNSKSLCLCIIALISSLFSIFYYVLLIKKVLFQKQLKINYFFLDKQHWTIIFLILIIYFWSFFHDNIFYFINLKTIFFFE